MLTIELFIAPLRILITALGTGVLPPSNPVESVRAANTDLAEISSGATASAKTVAQQWAGEGSRSAQTSAAHTDRTLAQVTANGEEIAALIESATGKVRHAAEQIGGLIDSLERTARLMGPALFTPAGLVAIVPVAIDHVARGAQIVARTQADLDGDTRRMLELARTIAPADATAPNGHQASPASADGRIPITLPDGSVAYAPNERAAKAVRAALSQRGVPYVWGGTTPNGFDCSGLTQWAYKQAGVDLPRLAQDQDTAGTAVSQAQLQPGDLAVWDGHVAMYIGNHQLVEAGDPVQVSPLRTTNAGQGFQGFYRPR